MTRRQPRSNKHPNATPAAGPSGVRTAPNPFALNPNPEVVDPLWLLKALAVLVALALGCGYLTLCVLFYQGQWQLVLHPSRSTSAPATIAGEPISVVHFGLDASATPQLTGWWLPTEPIAAYAAYPVLYLPGGDGSLADSDAPPPPPNSVCKKTPTVPGSTSPPADTSILPASSSLAPASAPRSPPSLPRNIRNPRPSSSALPSQICSTA